LRRALPALVGAGHRDGGGGGSILAVHLPSPRAFIRHALPGLLESTIGPAVLFYAVLLLAGFRGALIAALGWSYLAMARRVVRRQRVPGLLILGIVLVSLRTAVSFVTGSSFLYFVQPTAGTFLVAALFLGSVLARRPLAQHLAHDFLPLDPALLARPFVRQFFMRVSLLWAVVLLTNAGFVLWLLLESSLRAFVIERSVVSAVLTVGGVVLSTLWFVRTMRGQGVAVHWNSGLRVALAEASPSRRAAS
jgi:hypothetical protein